MVKKQKNAAKTLHQNQTQECILSAEFWMMFHVWTLYGDSLCKSPYSVQIWEIARNSVETVRSHKIYTPGNKVKFSIFAVKAVFKRPSTAQLLLKV